MFAWPFGRIYLDGLAGKVEYAQLLHDASEVGISGPPAHEVSAEGCPNTLSLSIPVKKPNVTVPVIELFLK